MRRTRPVGEDADAASSPQQAEAGRRRSHQGATSGGPRSVPPAVRLVTVLIFVWAIYISMVALGKGRESAATADTPAVVKVVRDDDAGGGNGSVHVDEGTGRGGVRELHMVGFEKGSGDGGEWRTCRGYQEDKLAKHKAVSGSQSVGYSSVLSCVSERTSRIRLNAVSRRVLIQQAVGSITLSQAPLTTNCIIFAVPALELLSMHVRTAPRW